MKMQFHIAAIALSLIAAPVSSGAAGNSHLDKIISSKRLRVCVWPEYYGISFRNPKTMEISGVDSDLAAEFAKDLGVKVQFIDTSFSKLIDDVESDKCDVAMFAVGVTPSRVNKLRFAKPTLQSDVYAISSTANRRIKTWSDIDQKGVVVAVMKGTLHEPVMRAALKAATLTVVDTPKAREQEVEAGRADVFMTDFPYSRKMLETTDWARVISPNGKFHMTDYAYAVAYGDDKWFARVERFVHDIKKDGRLLKAATRYKLDPIVVKD